MLKNLIVALLAAVSLLGMSADPAAAQSRSHAAAAEEMLTAMQARQMFEDAREGALRAQISANPALAPYEEVMRGFFDDFLTWEAVHDDYVRLHMARFTEAELRELAAFYRTPLGRRMAEESAALGVELSLVGQRIVESNQAELVRRITAVTNGAADSGGW